MSHRRIPALRKALIGTALVGALLTAGCATPTPYRPATGYGYNQTGYAEQRIEANRFQVSFSGNSVTARETVERYLLYRSAELTLQQGFDYFVLANRDTEKRTRTYATTTPGWGGYGAFGYWNPYWRYYNPRWGGWGSWGAFGDPWGPDVDVRTIDKYQAMAEIVMGKGEKPRDNVRAFDARSVIDNLGPTIEMPRD